LGIASLARWYLPFLAFELGDLAFGSSRLCGVVVPFLWSGTFFIILYCTNVTLFAAK
jgi:hypothetical protein